MQQQDHLSLCERRRLLQGIQRGLSEAAGRAEYQAGDFRVGKSAQTKSKFPPGVAVTHIPNTLSFYMGLWSVERKEGALLSLKAGSGGVCLV